MNDYNEIASCIGALAVHVDARQWEQLTELFTANVRTDYTSLFGGEPQSTTREQLIAGWRSLLPGFARTTHVIGTPRVELEGDTARASASVVAWHYVKEPALAGNDLWLVGGCYEIRLQRQHGRWRIESLSLARGWEEGNPDLPRIATERAAASADH